MSLTTVQHTVGLQERRTTLQQ